MGKEKSRGFQPEQLGRESPFMELGSLGGGFGEEVQELRFAHIILQIL